MGNGNDTRHPRAAFRPYQTHAEAAFSTFEGGPDPQAALVVLDTNVLLAPYRASAAALDAIKRVYTSLRSANRLLVPAEVAREFARNRPSLVAAVHKYVKDARTVGINGRYDPPPVLHDLPEHQRAVGHLEQARAAIIAYRKALDDIALSVANWQRKDPVLDVYHRLFDAAVVVDSVLEADALEQIRKERYAAQIAPGWRDKSKTDGGKGDLVIWMTILEVASAAPRDALFVTEERKTDWFHETDGDLMIPRHELEVEFASLTQGRRFGCCSLATLLSDMGVADEVVQEVRETTAHAQALEAMPMERIEAEVELRLKLSCEQVVRRSGGRGVQFIVRCAQRRVGVRIALVGHSSWRPINDILVAARVAVTAAAVDAVIVIFAATDPSTARGIVDRFAEERYLGPDLSAIVVLARGGILDVLVNQSDLPALHKAFPVTGG